LRSRDLSVLWHPCTQMAEHPDTLPLIPIRRGRGAWLEGVDGRRYLDAVSSWWTNLFGHGEPRIAEAIAVQARELEHVIFAGFGHEPGVRLAEELLRVAPPGLARVFYADNGSSAIEIALKMSFHSFLNRGEGKRQKFVALRNGYHGETIGALSMGAIADALVRADARCLRSRARRIRAGLRAASRRRARGDLRRARG
jgi:adenosylmethionine-8-amino-7-oxononanoate aminotransferase